MRVIRGEDAYSVSGEMTWAPQGVCVQLGRTGMFAVTGREGVWAEIEGRRAQNFCTWRAVVEGAPGC